MAEKLVWDASKLFMAFDGINKTTGIVGNNIQDLKDKIENGDYCIRTVHADPRTGVWITESGAQYLFLYSYKEEEASIPPKIVESIQNMSTTEMWDLFGELENEISDWLSRDTVQELIEFAGLGNCVSQFVKDYINDNL